MTEQTTPAPVGKIFQAILAVKRHLASEGVGKNQKNAQQGYSFRGIDDIMNAMAAPLVNAGITVVPNVLSRTQDVFITDSKKRVTSVALDTEFRFVADDGSYMTARIQSEASDYADKATNKAISFGLKYAFISVFNIPVVGADDGDFESPGNEVVDQSDGPVASAPRAVAKKKQAPKKTAEKPEVHPLVAKLSSITNTEVADHVAGLVKKAYGVSTVVDVPGAKVDEALSRIQRYLETQGKVTKAAAQPETADDIPE
jgi:ERF superfamily